MEIWKDIKDFEGLYQVSNFGRVRSLGNNKSRKTKILIPFKNKKGYLRVCLYKNGKRKMFSIHRLVAEAFIPNLFDYPEVNHKDEDKTNNFCGTPENDFNDGNLEWCESKYNINYGTRTERVSEKTTNGKLSKIVIQLTKTGELVREWPSTMEAGRNGFVQGSVSNCCRGKLKSHKGYIWKYKKEVV